MNAIRSAIFTAVVLFSYFASMPLQGASLPAQYPAVNHVLPPELNAPGVMPRIRNAARGFSVGATSSLFSKHATYNSGGAAPSSIAVADTNGDGRPDEILLNQCSTGNNGSCHGHGIVGVMLGNGDGTFQSPQTYDAGGYVATQVLAIDVNRDGKIDLVTLNVCGSDANCNSNGSIGVLFGNGDGTFQTVQAFDSGHFDPSSIAAGDINGDGNIDLIVSYYCDPADSSCAFGAVDIYLGNGDGTFRAPVDYSSGGYVTQEVVLGDMNGDGKPDLLVANCGSPNCFIGTVGVLLGNGDGTFQQAQTYDSGGVFAMAIAVGDVNGDGRLDLLVDNDCLSPGFCTEPAISVLLGNGDGTLQSAQTYTAGSYGCSNAGYCPVSIALADVNGDGIFDVVLPRDVLFGNGDGSFQSPLDYDTSRCDRGQAVVADLNGDGKPDVSIANYYARNGCGAGGVTILLNIIPQVTATTVLSSLNVSSYRQTIVFTATVTARGKTVPNGSVTFSDSGSVLGRSPLIAGVATFRTHSLTLGPHTILALYFGNTEFAASTSSVPQTVNVVGTNAVLAPVPDHLSYGQPITLRAEVVPAYGGTATGAVTFFDGTSSLATIALSNNRASLTMPVLAAGAHSFNVGYGGDSNFAPSTSAPLSRTVENARVSMTLSSSLNPAPVNQPVTFSLSVNGAAAIPTGTATLKLGATILGTASLVNGQATVTTTFPKARNYFVVAEYSGDQNYLTGNSHSYKQVVQK